MENASKALIIAGAILISILLISVGIMVMNSAGSATDEVGSTADSMAKQQFNSQFTAYEGTEKSANDVKQLIALIRSNNGTQGKGNIENIAVYNGKEYKTKTGGSNLTSKVVYLDGSSYTTTSSSGTTSTKYYITSTSALSATKTYTVEIVGYSKDGYVQVIRIK